jgi:hypothetical protein
MIQMEWDALRKLFAVFARNCRKATGKQLSVRFKSKWFAKFIMLSSPKAAAMLPAITGLLGL